MYIKRLINFFLEKELNKTTSNVRLRIKWNNSKNITSFGIGIKVDTEKWNYEMQRCKNNTTHGKDKIQANEVNKEIQRAYDIAESVFYYFESKNINPATDEFKTKFNQLNARKEIAKQSDTEKSFFDIYEEYTTIQGAINSWSKGMYDKFNALKMHLKNFDNDIYFENINEIFFINFTKYMQSAEAMIHCYKSADKGMKNTTAIKHITIFKMFLRWAKKNNHYNGTAHEDFMPKFKGTDGNNKEIIHLTWDELIHLYNFEFNDDYLSNVRDVFCLCCFTGLRYSDAFNLKKSDIKDDCIHIVTQKTSEGLKIELNKYSRAILEKYKNNGQEKALPVTTNKKMNDYLRTIGKITGIDEPQKIVYFVGNKRYEEVYPKHELLTSHCGRRTFIVNSLFLGIPAEVVMKWTGHSDYDAMKPYIKIVDELKQKEMKKFDLK